MSVRSLMLALLALAAAAAAAASAQAKETWIVRTELWGNPAFSTLVLDRDGARIAGDLDGDRVEGQTSASDASFSAIDRKGQVSRYVAGIEDGRMCGEVALSTWGKGCRQTPITMAGPY